MSYHKKDTRQKGFVVNLEEHRFAVRRGIALLIFHANVFKFSNEFRLGFKDKMYVKRRTLILAFLMKAISLKRDQ